MAQFMQSYHWKPVRLVLTALVIGRENPVQLRPRCRWEHRFTILLDKNKALFHLSASIPSRTDCLHILFLFFLHFLQLLHYYVRKVDFSESGLRFRDEEAAGSNPVASIPQKVPENKAFRHFFFWKQDMKKRFFGQKGAQKVHNLINTHHSCLNHSFLDQRLIAHTPLFLDPIRISIPFRDRYCSSLFTVLSEQPSFSASSFLVSSGSS